MNLLSGSVAKKCFLPPVRHVCEWDARSRRACVSSIPTSLPDRTLGCVDGALPVGEQGLVQQADSRPDR